MIENDMEWLKKRLCSCENSNLNDFERSESWGFNGVLEILLEFPSWMPIGFIFEIFYQITLGPMGYPNGVNFF